MACGLPWPRGTLRDAHQLRLEDDSGRSVPLQALVLDRWSDGSVRWVLLRWQATLRGRTTYEVRAAAADSVSAAVIGALRIDQRPDAIRILARDVEYLMEVGKAFPFAAVTTNGEPVLDVKRAGLRIVDAEGSTVQARVKEIALEESGPLYARVRLDCDVVGASNKSPLRVFARLAFFAASPVVRVDLTLHNSRRAMHPGGIWELGDPGSLLLKSASLSFALSAGGEARLFCSPETDVEEASYDLPFELYQDSSGGENWRSRVHLNRNGAVPVQFRGYRIRAGGNAIDGLRADPVVRLERGADRLALAMRNFWANFPKAVEADAEALTLHLFPPQSVDLHELQGGEQKTHTFFVAFGPDPVTNRPLDWCRSPARVRADPEWYCASGALPHLVPAAEAEDEEYDALVRSAIEGPESIVAKRERIDEYGWRSFGDIYADHEAAYYRGPQPIVSHYNNQYDAVAGFAQQFIRTGDFRWWDLMDDLAAHVADVDVYHTNEDKPAYNHGLFWHTAHYIDAGKSTHRSYPRAPGVRGGGPANEHNYTTGLMLHHFLTGNPLSRETVLELARWVIDMDDGSKTVFRWIARGSTGHASSTVDPGLPRPWARRRKFHQRAPRCVSAHARSRLSRQGRGASAALHPSRRRPRSTRPWERRAAVVVRRLPAEARPLPRHQGGARRAGHDVCLCANRALALRPLDGQT